MSSLDHQLVHGNSLTGIGTIAETLAALVPRTDTTGDPGFAGMIIEQELEASRRALEDAAALKEATSAESRAAADGYRRAIEAAWPARLLLDAAVAVRLELMSPPAGFDPDEIRGAAGSPDVQGPLSQLNVVHFPERFPEVFLRNRPGFDVLLGNPPWEKAKVETSRWWALRFPGLRSLPQGEQDRRIAALRIARPDLAAEIDAEVAANDALRRLLLRGPYPGMGVGDPDLYQAFAWRIAAVLRQGGRAGVVMPRSLVSEAGGTLWRREIFDTAVFEEVTMLLNTGRWVFDMEPRYSIALITIAKRHDDPRLVRLWGPYSSEVMFRRGVAEEPAEFVADEFREFGTGSAFPLISSPLDAEVYAVMKRHPRLDDTSGSWRVRGHRETDSSLEKHLFRLDNVPDGWWPVYKGESFDLWQPDTGRYYGGADPDVILPYLHEKRLRGARSRASAFSEFPRSVIEDDSTLPCLDARIAFRKITNRTNSRSLIAALVPRGYVSPTVHRNPAPPRERPRTQPTFSVPYAARRLTGRCDGWSK